MGLEGIKWSHRMPPSHSLERPWTPDASSMHGVLTHVLGADLGFLSVPSQLFTSPSPCQPPTVAALMPGCSGQQGQDKRQDQTKGADTQVISASPPCPPQPPELFADAGLSEPGASPRVALCRCQFIPEMRTQESLPHTPSHALPLFRSS